MKKYRKKPVIVDAIQWTGSNKNEVYKWEKSCGGEAMLVVREDMGFVYVHTLEGSMKANKNDWIIKGVKGEFYPCKPDIFEQTYEVVKD